MRITKDNQICKHEDWWCVTPRTGDVWPRELVMCDPEDWWCVTPRAGDVWPRGLVMCDPEGWWCMIPEGYHLSDTNRVHVRTQRAACVMQVTFRARSTCIKKQTLNKVRFRRLWKLFRPSECLHWSNNAKRHGMIPLPCMLWGCIGVPGHAGVWENEIADGLARGGSEVCWTWASLGNL